jgi:signal peptidase II
VPKQVAANIRRLAIPFLILAVTTAADQLSKYLALKNLTESETVQILGTFIQFKLVFNRGGALGTDLGNSAFYLVSSLIILAVIFYFTYANRHNAMLSWPLSFCAGGAIGNIIDRLAIGKVVDFIDVDFFNISVGGLSIDRWWVFNVADAAITVAIIFLAIYILIATEGKQRSRKSDAELVDQSQ